MRSTLATTAVLFSALKLASAQTFTDCNPLDKTCPSDPGLGKTLTTDFSKASSDWTLADGTSMSYGSNGAEFVISKKTDAPTISSSKYIMFGKVDVTMRACAGTGTVSSFILESDDLDEIDWEWLGSTDTSVESNFFGKGNTTTYDRAIYHPVSSPIENFITYTIDWTKDYVKWYIAGNLVRTLNYGDALALNGKNFPQTPMRIKMGNWIGCLDAAAASNPSTKGTCDWAGGYVDFAAAPFTMYVKSVTIQDYGCGGDYTYTDHSGSYQSISSSCSSGSSSESSSSSSSSSSTKSDSSSSSSTTTGGILKETSSTSVASNSSTSTDSSSASSTPTTLANVTASATNSVKTSSTGTAASTTAVRPTQSASAADNLGQKHKYGMLDAAVMVLGLGLGYLVM